MRKTIFTLGLMLAAALSLTNCTKNEEATFTPEVKVPFELYANMDDTRTTNDDIHTNWAANDEINVFHAVKGDIEYENDGSFSTVNGDGKFKGTLSETLDAGSSYDWYAFYPYTSQIETPANVSKGYTAIGSSASGTQTQTGNDSKAHIAGKNYPLYGVAKGVAASAKPSITMSHASSLVEFVVKNGTGEAFVVESIAFTAPEDIVGTYYINFASEPVAYTKSGNGYVSSTATLTVDGGTNVPADGAYFYMGIKPFTAAASSELTVNIETDKGTFAKTITLANETTFSAGLIKTITVNVNELTVPDDTAKELPFSETFGTSQGEFTIEDVELGSLSYVWSFAEGYGMKASGYYQGAKAAQSKLVSPLIAIPAETEGAPILTFDHCVGYGNSDTKDELTLWIKAKAADWQQVTIPNYPTISSSFSSFVSSGDIDLSAYKGQEIYVAFEYSSTTSNASTWEIKNVLIDTRKFSQTLSFPEASYTVKVGDSFTAPLLSGAKTAVTYSSSNEAVANVNATTGAITLGNTPGNTVITATAAEDGTYNSASASYTIVLEDASIVTATGTIDFSSTAQRISIGDDAQVWENDGITLTNSKGGGSIGDYSNPVRLYKNTDIEITSSVGKMTQIDFVCGSSSYANDLKNAIGSAATVSGSNVTVVLDGTSDTFTVRLTVGQVRVKKLTVTYLPADPTAPSMSVEETSVAVTAEATIEQVNVTLNNLEDGDVTVTSSESWVSASLSAGVLSLNIAENTDLAGREATITLSATDVEDVTITVSQQGAVTNDPVETLDMTSRGFTNAQEVSSVTGTNFTVTFNQGEASYAPKYYTTGTAVRVYGGGNFVISSTTKKFYKVVVTYDSGDGGNTVTADSGTYTNGTWTGTDTNSVTFSVGGSSGHRRIKKIEITYKN